MAKMFYTLDETKAALNRSEEDIKNLAREGRLREFRDGPRLMFKADQVETLKNELAGAPVDHVDLGPSDSGAPLGFADSRSGSGTAVRIDEAPTGASPGLMKDDTALSADLGLSGSVGGMPSPARPSGSGTGLSGTAGGRGGVSVFSADEVDSADPMAQTNISAGVKDQVNLEGVGSGSGLLDLTRESDDTSLGAELLDEITPAAPRRTPTESVVGTTAGSEGYAEPVAVPRGGMGQPILVEEPDALAPAFGAAALAAAVFVGFGIFALANAVVGAHPEFVKNLTAPQPDGMGWSIWMIFGVGLILTIAFFVVGMLLGKLGGSKA